MCEPVFPKRESQASPSGQCRDAPGGTLSRVVRHRLASLAGCFGKGWVSCLGTQSHAHTPSRLTGVWDPGQGAQVQGRDDGLASLAAWFGRGAQVQTIIAWGCA